MTGPAGSMPREPSAIDRIAEQYLSDQTAQDPLFATEIGVAGHDHLLTDFSPAACAARASSDHR